MRFISKIFEKPIAAGKLLLCILLAFLAIGIAGSIIGGFVFIGLMWYGLSFLWAVIITLIMLYGILLYFEIKEK